MTHPCPPRDPERAAFFAALGWHGGAVEIVAGSNQSANPDKIDLLVWNRDTFGSERPHTRVWIAPTDLAALERHIAELAAQWGNVYVSIGTYGRGPNPFRPGSSHFSRCTPLPRFGFVLDDVTDLSQLHLAPSWAIETSPNNFQVGYTSTVMLSPAHAAQLARGAARLSGCDLSGTDATQLIRVPNTLNTKAKYHGHAGDPTTDQAPQGWTVRLVLADGPRYTPEHLAAVFVPPTSEALSAPVRPATSAILTNTPEAVATPPPAPQSGSWANLPDGHTLMQTPRYQALFRKRPQLAALQRGERIALVTAAGIDSSDSQQVAVLIANLLTTGQTASNGTFIPGLGAPPLDEIRAVALVWHARLRPDYAMSHYLTDIDRLIAKYQPIGYHPIPTRIHTSPIPCLTPRQRGRPSGEQARQVEILDAVLATMTTDADGFIHTFRATLAQRLHLSIRTITTYLGILQRTHRLEYRPDPRELIIRRTPARRTPAKEFTCQPIQGIGTRHTAPPHARACHEIHTPRPAPAIVAPPTGAGAAPEAVPPSPANGFTYQPIQGIGTRQTAAPHARACHEIHTPPPAPAIVAPPTSVRAALEAAPEAAPPAPSAAVPGAKAPLAVSAPVAVQAAVSLLGTAAGASVAPVVLRPTLAELVAQIDAARDTIRLMLVQTINAETGRVTVKRTRATRQRVAVVLGVAADDPWFVVGWKKAMDTWGRYRDRLTGLTPAALRWELLVTTRQYVAARGRKARQLGWFRARMRMVERIAHQRGIVISMVP